MTQQNHLGSTATSIHNEDGFTHVVYHSTCIVRWDEKSIILNNGGWETQTTKTRMNQASNQFGLGYWIHQKDFSWYVQYKGKTIEFENGMTLRR